MNSNPASESDSRRALRRIVLCTGLSLTLLWLVGVGLGAAFAKAAPPPDGGSSTPRAASASGRPEDPVVLTGSRFPAFSGVPLNELVLYTYRGGDWLAVPFQIDQVNISGTYVTSDGGLLDANDELAFMARDAGEEANAALWPADTAARLYPRYAITVTDPLSASQPAWAYLYRSTTLTRSNVSYLTWTFATQTASALSYTAAFSPTKFVGLSDLFINGGTVDMLDRQKTRIKAFPFDFTEESIVSLLGSATISLPIAGPVRAVTNNGDLKAAFYGSRIDFDVIFNLASLPSVNFIRASFDWNNPITTGLTTYYDSNTASGVPLDGLPDVVSTTPPIDWFQVNGGASGSGGIVLAIPRVDPHGGSVTNYYLDNGAIDNTDTGDRRSYSDSGLLINGPFGTPAVISFTLMMYILPPGTSANVGAGYFARANNPLQAAAAQQCYAPAGCRLMLYLPAVMKNF